jgi:hypothetical protein
MHRRIISKKAVKSNMGATQKITLFVELIDAFLLYNNAVLGFPFLPKDLRLRAQLIRQMMISTKNDYSMLLKNSSTEKLEFEREKHFSQIDKLVIKFSWFDVELDGMLIYQEQGHRLKLPPSMDILLIHETGMA